MLERDESSVEAAQLIHSDEVVTVPVSFPVGTLMTGADFNVITSKLLCVDNGFISSVPVSQSSIQNARIVIQNPPTLAAGLNHKEPTHVSDRNRTRQEWADMANAPVLPVICRNTPAELYKERFGSGGRGKCIKYGLEWYTPSEFEALCGRALSKDWKRSIRFGTKCIQDLINEGVLTPHAANCTCGACCEDLSAIGPVQLFTPYKRRRRNQGSEEKKHKAKRDINPKDSDLDNLYQHSNNSHSKKAWQSIAEGLENNADYHLFHPDICDIIKRLDGFGESLTRLGGELKQCVKEVRVVSRKQLERLRQQKASAPPPVTVGVSVDVGESAKNKCANCNREASAECSLCRRTPYCSAYCRKKDWASHQMVCLRSEPSIHDQHQSIMLILENQQ